MSGYGSDASDPPHDHERLNICYAKKKRIGFSGLISLSGLIGCGSFGYRPRLSEQFEEFNRGIKFFRILDKVPDSLMAHNACPVVLCVFNDTQSGHGALFLKPVNHFHDCLFMIVSQELWAEKAELNLHHLLLNETLG